MNKISLGQSPSETAHFSKMAGKAVLSIIFFIGVYILLIIAALALTALFVWLGLILIIAKPMILTITLGAGIASVGVIVTFFLFKFIFSKHVENRSHLTEIKRENEPQLFALIQEVVSETGTQFPKKVYLATDVNAAVFYNSSFWSMFFPIRKNLQIGVGLMNSVNVSEFKAIVAHEFGHFSQKSMAIGSYVYTINRVIYNMLYDNTSLEKLAQSWNNVSSTFSIFIQFAFRIVEGIQWVLKKMYHVVNLSYMALSREMEFGADKVAAMITGSESAITALQRLDIAAGSFNNVIDYYNGRFEEAVCTKDIYAQHRFVYTFLALRYNIRLMEGLPMPTEEDLKRYNKSKLIIKDSWASHPDTEDRVERLRALNIPPKLQDKRLAITLLKDPQKTTAEITEKIFSVAEYKSEVKMIDLLEFERSYGQKFEDASFPPLYNGYFDYRGLITNAEASNVTLTNMKDLFSDAVMNKVYTLTALKNDLVTLKEINKGGIKIKKFVYDSLNFKSDDCPDLISRVNTELEQLEQELAEHDQKIYLSFKANAMEKGLQDKFSALFDTLKLIDNNYPEQVKLYTDMLRGIDFTNHTTPFDEIETNLKKFAELEEKLKAQIREILNDTKYNAHVSEKNRDVFETYLKAELVYFTRPGYNTENLLMLSKVMEGYFETVDHGYFRLKKEILNFMASLFSGSTPPFEQLGTVAQSA